MYEDFNVADIELYGVLKHFLTKDPNRQYWLNVTAFMVKGILNNYILGIHIPVKYKLPNNFVVVLKQCALLLEEPIVQLKLSDFLRQGSVESANCVICELDKYIVQHSIEQKQQ